MANSFMRWVKAQDTPDTMVAGMNRFFLSFFKMFFEAGGIPDYATNHNDFETLTGSFNSVNPHIKF